MELTQEQRNKILITAQKLKNDRIKNAFDDKNEYGTYNDGYEDALQNLIDEIIK